MQQRFRFSNRENIVIDRKNCIFAIENDIFDCRNALFAVFKNCTPISLLFAELVFFFLFLNTCELGSFYAFLETRLFL